MKRALITGITGQDGSYLAELLLSKWYKVYGLVRRSSNEKQFDRIQHLLEDITLITGDMTDEISLRQAIEKSAPDEVYDLAAMSQVKISFDQPAYTLMTDGLGVLYILEAIRTIKPDTRFYQASTSELYGQCSEVPQNESTPFHPRSPYGIAKLYAYWTTVNYREAYNIHASNGILHNHESQRRPLEFVTRKITHAAASIKLNITNKLLLGNLDAKRDWSYAPDMVEGMWRMLQQPKPDDYVLASGVTRTVRDFCKTAFDCVGLNYEDYVAVDPQFYRPAEVDILLGDASKARRVLGWEPKTSFEDMVHLMVDNDLRLLRDKR